MNVERQDGSSKHLSQNDLLAQVLGKEHPGRVRALGAGPCPTQVFGNAARQPSGSAESNAEDKRMIAELTAKLEKEWAKRQSIHKLGGNLPVEIAEELAFVGAVLKPPQNYNMFLPVRHLAAVVTAANWPLTAAKSKLHVAAVIPVVEQNRRYPFCRALSS
ncbi:hypothetical protein Ahy_B02g057991 [Arachis hypogaea]|uniref:Uncharacterized protein n=1 Tax=Arachis hypogaea TaxID=3818 RepID=A0A445ADI9_ARAHY|nr:hypothetical protein Ahy_B02g057991 [Arachis hypogaea]